MEAITVINRRILHLNDLLQKPHYQSGDELDIRINELEELRAEFEGEAGVKSLDDKGSVRSIGGEVKGENTGGAISLIIRLPLDVTYIQKIEKAVGISLGKLGFTQTTTSKDDTTTINYKQFITEVEG